MATQSNVVHLRHHNTEPMPSSSSGKPSAHAIICQLRRQVATAPVESDTEKQVQKENKQNETKTNGSTKANQRSKSAAEKRLAKKQRMPLEIIFRNGFQIRFS